MHKPIIPDDLAPNWRQIGPRRAPSGRRQNARLKFLGKPLTSLTLFKTSQADTLRHVTDTVPSSQQRLRTLRTLRTARTVRYFFKRK